LLATRIITGLLLGGAITVTVLFLPTEVAAVLFGALWLLGAWEWASLARLSAASRAAYVALLCVCMLLGMLVIAPRLVVEPAVAIATLWWLVALGAVLTYPRSFAPPVVAIIGFVVLLPSWGILSYLHSVEPRGRALTMTVLVIVWAADVGAYAAGRVLGRVKLAPKVSPGKTWEGVTGGVVLAAAAAYVAAQLLELPAASLVGLGVATALVSVVGDLTVSMFKRNVGIKDSGRLLPGHGGVMDRIDSLTAAVPVFALGLYLAGVLT
jgi:phosphatidate cytidylyltransferase